MLVLLAAGLHGRRRAAVTLFAVMMALAVFQQRPASELLFLASAFGILVVLLSRFGFLAWVVSYFPVMLLTGVALRFDAAPYATASYVAVGVIGALALYGLHTALAGRSLFGDVQSGNVAGYGAR